MPAPGVSHDGDREPDTLSMVLLHAMEAPGRLAVKDDHLSLSYDELRQRVEATASALVAAGAGPGERVALSLGNSAHFVVAALACMWVGALFVPLPAGDPTARLAYMVDDSDPALIVVDGSSSPALAPEVVNGRRTVTADELTGAGTSAGKPHGRPGTDVYIVYTSGTTGRPKGASIPRAALTRAVTTAVTVLGMSEETRMLCVSPFHFDGSYGNVFPALWAGGSLYIPPRRELLFLRRFFTSLDEDAITNTGFSPSYLRLLLSSRHLAMLEGTTLKTIALGGEECVPADVGRLWEIAPGIRVFNRYGPTETTIAVSYHEVTRADVDAESVPIGRPAAGVNFWLVAEDGTLVTEPGAVGELYIGGGQLMSGYWQDATRTTSVLAMGPAPEVTYRTGDLAYRDADGLYFYVGRADDVVKRNGVRISLAEIAMAFRRAPGVTGAVCLLVGSGDEARLVAFVESRPGARPEDLMLVAGAQLSDAMRPDQVVVVGSLPTATSGKVDRQALLAAHFPGASGTT